MVINSALRAYIRALRFALHSGFFRFNLKKAYIRTAPLSVYNENLSFQSGTSPLRVLEVESYHFEMTHRNTRSTLAVRFSRVGNYNFLSAQSPSFSRKTENEVYVCRCCRRLRYSGCLRSRSAIRELPGMGERGSLHWITGETTILCRCWAHVSGIRGARD